MKVITHASSRIISLLSSLNHPSVNEGDHSTVPVYFLTEVPSLNHPSVNEGDHASKITTVSVRGWKSLNHPSVNEGDHPTTCALTQWKGVPSQSPFSE